MKRSQQIRLVLIGGVSSVLLSSQEAARSAQSSALGRVLTNDHYLAGSGYYHAPYRDWFPYPYNYLDPAKKLYFHGGNWTDKPHESFTNLSTPVRPIILQSPRVVPVPVNTPANSSSSGFVSRGGFGSHSWSSSGSGS